MIFIAGVGVVVGAVVMAFCIALCSAAKTGDELNVYIQDNKEGVGASD